MTGGTKTLVVLLDDTCLAEAPTPNINRLAAIGWKVPRFVGGVCCSNARGQLDSGQYPFRSLIGGNFKDTTTWSPDPSGWLANQAFGAHQWGKWHLCAFGNLTHRFVAGYTNFGGSQANLGYGPHNYFDWIAVVNGVEQQITTYATDWTIDSAIGSMEFNVQLVVCSLNAIHKPWHTPPGMTEYGRAAMLAYTDAALGRLFEAAINGGYRIVVMSDQCGTHDDGGKGTLDATAIASTCILYGFGAYQPQLAQWTDAAAWVLDADWQDGKLLRSIAFADGGFAVGSLPTTWDRMATDGNRKLIVFDDGTWDKRLWDDTPAPEVDMDDLFDAMEAR